MLTSRQCRKLGWWLIERALEIERKKQKKRTAWLIKERDRFEFRLAAAIARGEYKNKVIAGLRGYITRMKREAKGRSK
jgi:hypothetical protein